MNYFTTSALINAVACTWFCFFVLTAPVKSKINSTFCFFLISITVWAICQFLWLSAPSKDLALIYSRIALTSGYFIPTTFLHFSSLITEEQDRFKKIITASYIINVIIIPLNLFTGLLFPSAQTVPHIKYYPLAGPLFDLMFCQYNIFIVQGLILLRRKALSSPHFEKINVVFWGILIAYIGGLTNFPLCYNIQIYPIGNIFIPAIVISVFYGILRFQLMDIRIIIQKNLIYTIMVIFISLLYFFSIFIIEHYFKEIIGYKSFVISILFALVISLIFIPLKNFVQSLTEKVIFKGNYLEITQQNEQLRQEVAQTERLRSIAILASGLAHEIKNPLTPLKTFSEYLPSRIDDKEFLKKFSTIIDHEVTRIDKLVHELLDFAKPSPADLKPNNIHHLLNNTIDLLSNDFIKNKINVLKHFSTSEDIILNIDQNQFKQAMLNLILNAIDAMPNGGSITFSTVLINNQTFQLKIHDTGSGIDPKDISHIFDPFFSKKDHGTGLGLSVTHEIIKNQQGKIFVESKKGCWTSFIIELPLISYAN